MKRPFDFARAMQMRREAGEYAGNTLAQKAEGICALEASRTPLTPDWGLRFSRQLQVAALETQTFGKIFASQNVLREANAAWRPLWQISALPVLDSQTPRVMTRYDPSGSLALLRREINLLVSPPAYVQNSPQRQTLLSRQCSHIAQTFKQFIEELPFMVGYVGTYEDYHPDREPIVRGEIVGVNVEFYNEVERELARLPMPLQEELRTHYLVFKYGLLLVTRNGEFLKTGTLAHMNGSNLVLVQRFAYFVARLYPNGNKAAIEPLLKGRSPFERTQIQLAHWRGTEEGKFLQPEPEFVNSANSPADIENSLEGSVGVLSVNWLMGFKGNFLTRHPKARVSATF